VCERVDYGFFLEWSVLAVLMLCRRAAKRTKGPQARLISNGNFSYHLVVVMDSNLQHGCLVGLYLRFKFKLSLLYRSSEQFTMKTPSTERKRPRF
jgi:hypothetical protein